MLPDFRLETYFSRWEFTARHNLTASDAQSMSLTELLALADDDGRQRWESLHLGYTETYGLPALREAIASTYEHVTPDDVICFAGAEEAIYLAMRTLLAPDDHVVVLTPNYQAAETVPLSLCEVSGVALRAEDDWALDVEAVERQLRPSTRIVSVNFPNNPTGAVPDPASWQRLVNLCTERGILLFSDEVYRGLELPGRTALPQAADVLSGGRLNPGVSVGPPMRYDEVKLALYPDTADIEDFGYERVRRLLDFIGGEPATGFNGTAGFEQFSNRVQPHSPGLRSRMWYGGASLGSARWAGEHGVHLLTSNVVKAEQAEDFTEIQLSHIRTFREHHPDGDQARVSQGLVVIPTDSATAEQRARYQAYVDERTPRTGQTHGPARMMFAPDIIGTSAQIAERLHADPAFQQVDEVAFALPFTFQHADYVQILTDIATKLGPELGWRPAG